jgi:hypothetical protein
MNEEQFSASNGLIGSKVEVVVLFARELIPHWLAIRLVAPYCPLLGHV